MAKKRKTSLSSDFGTRFSRKVALFWEIYRINSLITQCRTSICAENKHDPFSCFVKTLDHDRQTLGRSICCAMHMWCSVKKLQVFISICLLVYAFTVCIVKKPAAVISPVLVTGFGFLLSACFVRSVTFV